MEETGIELKVYLRILQRWWWLLLIGAVGGAVAAYFLTGLITPTYESTTKVLVQGGQTPGTPFLPEAQASQDLARNYRDLIKTRPILERVIQDLSLPYDTEKLSEKLSVSSPRSLIEISVGDPDPEVAASIANTTAVIFIEDFRSRQFAQIAQLQASLSQQGIVGDTSIITAQASTLSTLSIVEEAQPARSPSSPRIRLNTILAGVVGLMFAGLVVFVIEHLNDRIRSEDEIRSLTDMPSLGSIIRYGSHDMVGVAILSEETRIVPLAESFKFLATNLDFAASQATGATSFLVTSSVPEEGKSTIASNLAALLAARGKSVILVDADLRKPSLDQIFDIQDQAGLTDIISGKANVDEAISQSELEGLRVVTSGELPMDPTILLSSPRMKELVKQLEERSDWVIFDSPPLLTVTDPMMVARLVDGVILVVDIRLTTRAEVKQAADTLGQIKLAVSGIVLNKLTPKDTTYYQYGTYSLHSDGRHPK